MPALSATPYAKPAQVGRSRSDVSLMRDKNGCITCRVRQKKCSGLEAGQMSCTDCLRLNIQCLGVSHNRPDWLRNVSHCSSFDNSTVSSGCHPSRRHRLPITQADIFPCRATTIPHRPPHPPRLHMLRCHVRQHLLKTACLFRPTCVTTQVES
ncbi:hypothetical protein RSAG8_00680, partial [Rhizoctonia solani AG-8 WAC10335]